MSIEDSGAEVNVGADDITGRGAVPDRGAVPVQIVVLFQIGARENADHFTSRERGMFTNTSYPDTTAVTPVFASYPDTNP